MKSFFKKATPFLLVFSSLAVAASLVTKEAVNEKIAALIAPLNNDTTSIALKFKALNVDSVRALDFGFDALVTKKGPENNLVFHAKNLSYHYGNGTNPTMSGNLFLSLDLEKAFGSNTMNQAGTELDKMIKNFASDFGKKYGDALTLDVAMDELNKDAQGNVKYVRVHLNANIDLNKLPSDIPSKEVEIKTINVRLAISKYGVNANARVVLNPSFKYYQPDQTGLKEYIEKLLNQDNETYQRLSDMAVWLNLAADNLVNTKAK
ncbi:MAG: hypothetical protein ACXVCY_15095 [Pseudobdellovibrionaceae bacterium]